MAERDHDLVAGTDPLPLSGVELAAVQFLTGHGYDSVEVRRVLLTLRLVERERDVRERCGHLTAIERRRVHRKLRDSDALPEKIANTVLQRRHLEALVGGKPFSPKELHALILGEGKGLSEDEIVSAIRASRAAGS